MFSNYKTKIIFVGGFGDAACKSGFTTIKSINENIDIAVINTDSISMFDTPADTKIAIGELGAGGEPSVAYDAMKNKHDELTAFLDDAQIAVIVAGLGKGTGTGAGLYVAQAASKLNIKTFGLFRTPDEFVGQKRVKIANDYLEQYKKTLNGILHISNDKVNALMIERGVATFNQSLEQSMQPTLDALESFVSIVSRSGPQNADLNDLCAIVSNQFVVQNFRTDDGNINFDWSLYDIDTKQARSAIIIIETPARGENAVNELRARMNAMQRFHKQLNPELDVNIIDAVHVNESLNGQVNVIVLLSHFEKTRAEINRENGMLGHAARYNLANVGESGNGENTTLANSGK